jgi:serine/threonine protein kinase
METEVARESVAGDALRKGARTAAARPKARAVAVGAVLDLERGASLLAGRYEFVESIHLTGSSEVLCCRDVRAASAGSSSLVAVKVLHSHVSHELALQEFATLAALAASGGGEHIVRPLGVFSHLGRTCIAQELLGPSLHDVSLVATRVPGAWLRHVAAGALQGLRFLHARGTIHADVKPGNIALTWARSGVKLLDLGNALEPGDAALYFDRFEVQTLRYRAPEVLFGCKSFGTGIDVWSLGLALLEAAGGRALFTAAHWADLVAQWEAFFGPIDPRPFAEGKFVQERLASPRRDRIGEASERSEARAMAAPGAAGRAAAAAAAAAASPAAAAAAATAAAQPTEAGGAAFRAFTCPAGASGGRKLVRPLEQALEQALEHALEHPFERRPRRSTRCELDEDDADEDAAMCESARLRARVNLSRFLAGTQLAGDTAAVDFFSKLLALDPRERLCAGQALEHPFIVAAGGGGGSGAR